MLLKKEIIYREILIEALEKKQQRFTQLSLSRKFNFSLSTVNNALLPLEKFGAIEKRTRYFLLLDVKKMLTYWASIRKFSKDIVYSTRANLFVQKIEGEMPHDAVFTAYSAYRFLFDEAPADYGEVYVYGDKDTVEEIKNRFPKKEGPQNIIVLEKDEYMPKSNVAPLPQLYVDLWNLKEWYAKDFLDALEKRMFQ